MSTEQTIFYESSHKTIKKWWNGCKKKAPTLQITCMGAIGLYKFGDNQISFSDFGQPVGKKMNPNNRWVRKAETIPWKECEIRYAHLFSQQQHVFVNRTHHMDCRIVSLAQPFLEPYVKKRQAPTQRLMPVFFTNPAPCRSCSLHSNSCGRCSSERPRGC